MRNSKFKLRRLDSCSYISYRYDIQVSLLIKSPLGISYMYVNSDQHIVVRHRIPDPDSLQGIVHLY